MKAKIFDIKRMAIHDGNGIRTTVFFKGCPLKCVWCHNPEGIRFEPQLAFYEDNCTGCGACVAACRSYAHRIVGGKHSLVRERCSGCGVCEGRCPNDALRLYGKEISVGELIPILLEDKDFYDITGGGVTVSGGECLMQAEFCRELLCKLKDLGVNTAVDTCGYVPASAIDAVMPYTDTFLFDIKAYDEDVHVKCTGKSNRLILDNLKYIDSYGQKTEVRIPYVPGYNDDQIEKIGAFLTKLKNVTKIRVLPYHNYAGSKYSSLAMENKLPATLPTAEEIAKAERTIAPYLVSSHPPKKQYR